MPLFAIIAYDKAGAGALRSETRPAHLEYLRAVEPSIKAAGPIDDEAGQPIGSLIILNRDDLAAARAFADGDPYTRVGLFADVRISPWRQVLPTA